MATTASSHMVLDFAPFIEERTRQFTGRNWVFKAIGEWLGDQTGSRVFLLTGGPGTGKTAIAARVVQMQLGTVPADPLTKLSRGFLAHFHFCQAGLESTLSPLTFVQSLAQTLANRFPAYQAALERQGSQQFVISSVVTVKGNVATGAQVTGAQIEIEILGGDARPLFDQMVRRPLRTSCTKAVRSTRSPFSWIRSTKRSRSIPIRTLLNFCAWCRTFRRKCAFCLHAGRTTSAYSTSSARRRST